MFCFPFYCLINILWSMAFPLKCRRILIYVRIWYWHGMRWIWGQNGEWKFNWLPDMVRRHITQIQIDDTHLIFPPNCKLMLAVVYEYFVVFLFRLPCCLIDQLNWFWNKINFRVDSLSNDVRFCFDGISYRLHVTLFSFIE